MFVVIALTTELESVLDIQNKHVRYLLIIQAVISPKIYECAAAAIVAVLGT
jgi:hypothetical protein